MKSLKTTVAALTTFAAFALVSLGAMSTASAQMGLCRYDDPNCQQSCTTNWDCAPGYECMGGYCAEPYCGRYGHWDQGPTVAVFDEDPGDYVVINSGPGPDGDMNVYDPRYCDGGCGTTYTSNAVLNAGACGTGQCPAGWEWNVVACDGCGGGQLNDNRKPLSHENLVKQGKYEVVPTGQYCDWNGGIVVELLPCGC